MMTQKRILSGDDPDVVQFKQDILYNPWKRRAMRSFMNRSLNVRIGRMKTDGTNLILSIAGKTGFGKSTVAWYVGDSLLYVYDREMKAGFIYFDDGEMFMAMGDSKEGDLFIKDEQPETFGVGSTQMSSQMANIERTVRKGEVSMFYCDPEVKVHCHHYILQPAVQLWNTGIMPVIKNRNQVLSWVYTSSEHYRKRIPVGVLLTGLPKGFDIDETKVGQKNRVIPSKEYMKYLKAKDEFIARVKRGDVSSGSSYIEDKVAEEFIENEDLMEYRKNKDILTALNRIDKPYNRNFTTGQFDMIKELIKVKCRERGIEKGWKD